MVKHHYQLPYKTIEKYRVSDPAAGREPPDVFAIVDAGHVYIVKNDHGKFHEVRKHDRDYYELVEPLPVKLKPNIVHVSLKEGNFVKWDFADWHDMHARVPVLDASPELIEKSIHALAGKLTPRRRDIKPNRPATAPYVAKKQSQELTTSLEAIVEAMVEKKLAQGDRIRSVTNELHAALTETMKSQHAPGYKASVAAGADVRARILSAPEFVSSEGLAKQLGVSRETVNQRRQKGLLLALSHGSRTQRYPTWQLEPAVSGSIPQLLEILGKLDPWTQYFFITQQNPALDGLSPLDALRNRDHESVLAAAVEYADVMAPT
jgi:hypothetical protein